MSEETKNVSEEQKTEARRDFIKKTAYIAPVVVTMGMTASFAAHGSTATNGGGYNNPNGTNCPIGQTDIAGTGCLPE